MRKLTMRLIGLGILCLASIVRAEGRIPSSDDAAVGPPLALSLKLARRALDECSRRGLAASVAVVDSKGVTKVVLRADGSNKSPDAAPRKAATAAYFDAPGADMERREKADEAFAMTIAENMARFNPHGGSLPLHKNGRIYGGLAVGDVPHEAADACARAALDTIEPPLR